MRLLPTLLLATTALAGGLPACGADHVTAIEESDGTQQTVLEPTKPADPSDPFGSCENDPNDSYDTFLCSAGGGDCQVLADIGLCADGVCEYGRLWQWCMHTCETAGDCPVPWTGNAQPDCPGQWCQLPCDENTTCPDGFICANPNDNGFPLSDGRPVCTQYVELSPYTPSPSDPLGL